MEQRLFQRISGGSLPRRLARIVADLLHRQEMIHHLKPDPDRLAELSERVQEVRQAILAQIEDQYPGPTVHSQAQTMDRTWRLSSFLRNLLRQGREYSDQSRAQFRDDLAEFKRVAQMGSWQPQYVDLDPSQERLAEMVLKLEREVYGIQRPHQLAKRDVFLRIGEPIDLGRFVPCYLQDPQAVRRRVAEQLRDVIQDLIDAIVNPPGVSCPQGREPTLPRGDDDHVLAVLFCPTGVIDRPTVDSVNVTGAQCEWFGPDLDGPAVGADAQKPIVATVQPRGHGPGFPTRGQLGEGLGRRSVRIIGVAPEECPQPCRDWRGRPSIKAVPSCNRRRTSDCEDP